MKARLRRLDLWEELFFDLYGMFEEKYTKPYIIQTKKHWWNWWKDVMDEQTGVPRLFFGKESAIDFL